MEKQISSSDIADLKSLLALSFIDDVGTVKTVARTGERLEINDEEKAICNILGSGSKHIHNIARELRIPAARLSGLLLGLAMKGIVRQTEGNIFSIV